MSGAERIWVLGPDSPELQLIERVLVEAGERFVFAMNVDGTARATTPHAEDNSWIDPADEPDHWDDIIVVGCLPTSRRTRIIGGTRPRAFEATLLGQTLALLAQFGSRSAVGTQGERTHVATTAGFNALCGIPFSWIAGDPQGAWYWKHAVNEMTTRLLPQDTAYEAKHYPPVCPWCALGVQWDLAHAEADAYAGPTWPQGQILALARQRAGALADLQLRGKGGAS